MNARTTLAADGHVTIPQDVLDALGMQSGQELDVAAVDGGVWLSKPVDNDKLTMEDALQHLRSIRLYDGPPIPVEKLSFPSPEEWRALTEGRPEV